jgi:hypothetical protein
MFNSNENAILIFIIIVLLYILFKCKGIKLPSLESSSSPPAIEGMANSDWGTGVKDRELKEREQQALESPLMDPSEMNKFIALEPEVFSSHEEYVKDMLGVTSTASSRTEVDHDSNPVPFVGLPRFTNCEVAVLPDVRVEPSQFQDQMRCRREGKYCL